MPDSSFDNTNETQQAQHSVSNDTPTDVNFNAVMARVQAQTTSNAGNAFESAAARRANAADAATERRQILADQSIKSA